ncbi:MAG TPA: DNA-processing protein DprA [Ideonella sp.]|nr:DNA-processing protein DprA [Ideonella sp.]
MDADELGAWLRLIETPGIGVESARRLLAAYGSPQSVLDAGPGGWRQVAGAAAASALQTVPETLAAQLAHTLAWLAAEPGRRHVLTYGDPAYPAALLNTADPPPMLYARGELALLGAPSLAIVGSRNSTPQGDDNARAFAAHLSERGVTIVSGLALGIDGAAHEGALTGRGSTIAVVGTGLDLVYPRSHRALAHRISERGLLLSELSLGTPSLGVNFPRRNRIIAGLSLGTLVVEAALRSGSLITARLALECGRDVFAIPGSIHSPQSRGCHRLIKDGAKLVEAAEDILGELRLPSAAKTVAATEPADEPRGAAPDERSLLAAMGHDPVTLDALGARTGWPSERLSAMLLALELAGELARLPGGLFQRRGLG